VFQLLLSTKRDAVPITRDFMIDAERAASAKTAQSGHSSGRPQRQRYERKRPSHRSSVE
jgi:hypothetical protein